MLPNRRAASVLMIGCLVWSGCSSKQDQPPRSTARAPAKEASAPPPPPKLFAVKQGAKCGYMDQQGAVVIAAQFDEARAFAGGLGAVRVEKKWGYVDAAGQVKIQPQYQAAGDFSEGLAWVSVEAPKQKAAKSEGGLVELTPGDSGRLEADAGGSGKETGTYGYIDPTGRMVIAPRFHEAAAFSESVAVVCLKPTLYRNTVYLTTSGLRQESKLIQTKKVGFVDSQGTLLGGAEFDAASDFHSGLAPVQVGGKWGYLAKSGQVQIEPRFTAAREFQQGLAPVKVGLKWSYVDPSGRMAVEAQFDDARPFSGNLAPARMGAKWGYVDETGVWRIKPQFADALPFSENLAAVKSGAKWGFIDPAGQLVIQPQYDSAARFVSGLAEVTKAKAKSYVDAHGTPVPKQPPTI